MMTKAALDAKPSFACCQGDANTKKLVLPFVAHAKPWEF